MTPWTVAHQAPLSLGFSRQEHWSRLPFPPPGDLPESGIDPCLLHYRRILYLLSPWGSPSVKMCGTNTQHRAWLSESAEDVLRNPAVSSERQDCLVNVHSFSGSTSPHKSGEKSLSSLFSPQYLRWGVHYVPGEVPGAPVLPSLKSRRERQQRRADTPEHIIWWRGECEGWREVGHGAWGSRGQGSAP